MTKNKMLLKDFRKEMKNKGYIVKSRTHDFSDLTRDTYLSVKVYDGDILINQGFQCKEHYEKYADIIKILNDNKIVK